MTDEMKRIGVMVGREWSWPPAFVDEVNRRNAGVTAEYVKLGGTRMNEANPYAVIVDRGAPARPVRPRRRRRPSRRAAALAAAAWRGE